MSQISVTQKSSNISNMSIIEVFKIFHKMFYGCSVCILSLFCSGLIVPKTEPQSSNDHPLLRQVLEDFSFEPKFEDNFDFRAEIKSELDQSLSNVKMDPVISLAMEQVNKDIETTCQILHISPGWFFPKVLHSHYFHSFEVHFFFSLSHFSSFLLFIFLLFFYSFFFL